MIQSYYQFFFTALIFGNFSMENNHFFFTASIFDFGNFSIENTVLFCKA